MNCFRLFWVTSASSRLCVVIIELRMYDGYVRFFFVVRW